MRFPRLVPLVLAAFASASFASAAEPALTRLVPADTAIVVALRDLPALRARFPESASGRAWADPEIARFFAPLSGHPEIAEMIEKVKAETGHTPAELFALATGDVLLTVPAGSLRFSGDNPGADVFLALEIGENEAKITELVAAARAKDASAGTASTEDYNGATIHTFTPASPAATPPGADAVSAPAEPLVWSLHQGRWFLSTDRALVTAALDALAAGGLPESLATSSDYQKVLDRAGGGADVLAFLNWKAVYPALISAIEAARDPKEAPNPFGMEPVNIMKALGLDAIESFSVSAGTVGDLDRVDAALTYTEARGVVNLLAYRDGPVARPDWVPAAWFNVSSQNFSVPEAYAELERILDRVSPMVAGMAQGQLKTFERQLGLDLKRDLIGNLGESFISGYALPAGADADNPPAHDQLDQFIGISLADAASFERSLETIKAKYLPPGDASPIKTRDYLGRKLHTFETAPGARGASYAITDGWLLLGIGSPASVESVVQLLNAPNPTASFWQRADVREALLSAPTGAFSIQHTELAPLLASLASTLVKVQEDQDDEEGRLVDPEAKPTREQLARYFKHSVSHGTRTSEGLFFHSEGPTR
ncbi:MAG: hypothetical protein H7067_02620 [Burkholderiales bacterium]|nr:hypothetical protein [Opitutaceae bacterium]